MISLSDSFFEKEKEYMQYIITTYDINYWSKDRKHIALI